MPAGLTLEQFVVGLIVILGGGSGGLGGLWWALRARVDDRIKAAIAPVQADVDDICERMLSDAEREKVREAVTIANRNYEHLRNDKARLDRFERELADARTAQQTDRETLIRLDERVAAMDNRTQEILRILKNGRGSS